MLDVICVCRSGGVYDGEWVQKLRDGVARNLKQPHRFRCLTDIEVPCEAIPFKHDWKGWWSKLELFRPGVVENPTIYFDLDVVIVDNIDPISRIDCDFAILRNFWVDNLCNSSMMWFSGENVPTGIYAKFAKQAKAYMDYYERHADGPYVGDQAFIWDTMDRDVEYINDRFNHIRSYKMHCTKRVPPETAVVCFHGQPRPHEVDHDWMKRHWA